MLVQQREGYGFLSPQSGPDVFVHYSVIHADGYKTLKEGYAVRYDIGLAQRADPKQLTFALPDRADRKTAPPTSSHGLERVGERAHAFHPDIGPQRHTRVGVTK